MVVNRELVKEGVDAVQPFQGRRLMGALCGEIVTINSASRREMEDLCKKHELEIWLPDGNGFDKGDGCIISPVAPTCSALAQLARQSTGILHQLPRQQWQRRPNRISQFLSQRPIWLAFIRPSIQGFVCPR